MSMVQDDAGFLGADGMTAAESKGIARVILGVVTGRYDVSADDLRGPKRLREVVEPRKIAMYLCRECGDMPFASVGEVFNRDHSTVIFACSEVEKKMKIDELFCAEISELKDEVDCAIASR